MHNHLHDEIDELEGLLEEARKRVESRSKATLKEALARGVGVSHSLAAAAFAAGEEITDLTTDAFRLGADFARRRSERG